MQFERSAGQHGSAFLDIIQHPRQPTGGIDDQTVVLVDDVIYTGRSSRAAMETVMDYGRPNSIQLAVLVDRGHRELPIQPDYVGFTLDTYPGQRVIVHLKELDSKDEVLVVEE